MAVLTRIICKKTLKPKTDNNNQINVAIL